MYAARLLIVCFLILGFAIAYNPTGREQVEETWEDVRPAVVHVMDNLYAVVRTLIAGDGRGDWIDNEPLPPGADFDRIITMSSCDRFL